MQVIPEEKQSILGHWFGEERRTLIIYRFDVNAVIEKTDHGKSTHGKSNDTQRDRN